MYLHNLVMLIFFYLDVGCIDRDFVHALDVSFSETKHLRTCHGCQLELMWIVQGMEELASEHAVRSPCSWLYVS